MVCHNDFAPYNFVCTGRKLTGVIDWDTASPGPRAWDLGYLAYRLVPLTGPGNPEVPLSSEHERAARLRTMCDAYGGITPADALRAAVDRLDDLVAFTTRRADVTGSDELRGHVASYLADVAYVRTLIW